MDSLLADLRYGIRALLKRPVFSAIAVITLALGIGANSAIFSAINALLLKPLPIRNQDRVVAIWDKNPSRGIDHNEVAFANYLDWRAQNHSFDQLALERWWSPNLTGSDMPERIQGFLVSSNFFDVVGVKPVWGRNFLPDENEAGKDRVAIIAHSLWQRRFGSDPAIVNKTITTNGYARTVIGVLPEGFNYPKGAEIYAPMPVTPELAKSRGNHSYNVIGRLKDGVTLPSAQADIDTITARLATQYPETNVGLGATVYPIVADTTRIYSTAMWIMMAAVGFVLLIACANVANLTLARAGARQKEIALRTALGASRWRIVRQLLIECLVIALLGGAAGIVVAYWGIDMLRAANPGDAAKYADGWKNFGLNYQVLAFTFGLSLLSGFVFGLAPAWQVSKPNVNAALKEGGRNTSAGSHRLRSLLVVSEIALSLMLLIGAGLFMRSFAALLKSDPGFNPSGVLTANLNLPTAKYKDPAQRAAFYDDLMQRVKSLPGVQSAAAVNYIPLGGSNSSEDFLIEGAPEPKAGEENGGRYRVCTPDYFQTMGISVLKGRGFTAQDKTGSLPVVIVNETLARKYWPAGDALGKRIRFDAPLERAPWMEIVGIVQDVKHELNLPVTPEYYLPHAQDSWNSMVLVARTTVDPGSMAAAIRQQVLAIDKDQPVFDIKTMQEVRSISISVYSIGSVTMTIFAIVALLLAAVGIYGVMAFAVSQRTQEIGIRMALGARALDVLTLILRNGMLLALVGTGIGLGGAFVLTRFMSSLLFGVSPTDIATFALVTTGLLLVALFACYLPARRATKVDPLVALRYE
ncbi:MAG TPA: ABC transporter permease [Pyrinomonadaceae bacterium]|nr:ABC transporter permease [Pyrinomonadaceae bacterium]